MTDEEWVKFHDERFAEMEPQFRTECVEYLKWLFSKALCNEIRSLIEKDPLHWMAEHHFFWGMQVRNSLRQAGFLDEQLPTMNWDDYYTQVIEAAVGKREY